jgi:predicted aldo/keto reductase-like oxidoreductase
MIMRSVAGRPAGLLGFGCMRFPLDADGEVDEERAIALLRRGIDGGINYIDTAYGYHDGKSEGIVGRALADGYREKVILTTKLPGWETDTTEDFERIFTEQLTRLRTDYVDFYLVHSLYDELWDKLQELDVLTFLDKIRADGRAKKIGFSFHDEFPVFEKILSAYDWDVCQIQYNLVDEQYQAGRKGLELARTKGIDVIIMEPLRGGALVNRIPPDIDACWKRSGIDRSPVEWAFRFAADDPGVKVILSGMSDEAQVGQNLAIFSRTFAPLSDNELKVIREVQDLYKSKIKVSCTGCEYCLPCPHNVAIAKIFSLYNNIFMFEDVERSREKYRALVEDEKDQGQCDACGICESLCPQHLEIRKMLREADSFLKDDTSTQKE